MVRTRVPNSKSDDATESVVDSLDSNDNVYDVHYNMHEYEDIDTESSGFANPEASWVVRIG